MKPQENPIMRSVRNLSVAILAVVTALVSSAAPQDGYEPVRAVSSFSNGTDAVEYFVQRRIAYRELVPVEELVQRYSATEMVQHLKELSTQSSENEQLAVMDTMAEIARRSSDRTLREQTVEDILSAALAGDAERSTLDLLLSFEGGDFNSEARRLLLNELSRVASSDTAREIDDRIVRWIASAGVSQAVPILRELDGTQREEQRTEGNPFYNRRAILALAQLGERDAIKEVLALVDGVEDPERRAINLEQLAYVRQPEVVQYLKRFLFSDVVFETKSRDVLPVSESRRAAWALGAMIEGFPVRGTLEEQRAWMNARTYYTFKGKRTAEGTVPTER